MPPPKNGWEGTMKAAHRSSCVAGQSPRSLPGRTMNPGAVCAKELKQGVTTSCPGNGVRAVGDILPRYITTLGNGYLGSRIDEERSEMRYLV